VLYWVQECVLWDFFVHVNTTCDWIWQKSVLTHIALLGDTEILSNHCMVASQCLRLCKWNLHQLLIHLLVIIVWVYKFLTPNFALYWAAFFEQVIVSQVIVIEEVGGDGLNIGVLNEGRRQMESRDQVMALCGSSLHSNNSKLSDSLLASCLLSLSSLQTIPTRPWYLNSTNRPLVVFTGSGKSCNKKQICYPTRKYSVQNESALDQQSIYGKIISLILCVWKRNLVIYSLYHMYK